MDRKAILVAAGVLCAGAAHAVVLDLNINVANTVSYGAYGSSNNVVRVLDLDALLGANYRDYRLIGVGWNVNLTANAPSWLSEITLEMARTDGDDGLFLRPGVGDEVPGTASYNSSGVVALDPNLQFAVGSDDRVRLEFFEDFDDANLEPDGNWNSGTVTMRFEAVPEPGTVAALALGVAALAARRRRKAS